MFVDASAMVAVLAGEPERSALLKALDETSAAVTSPLAIFETVTALTRRKVQSVEASQTQVREFLAAAAITIVPIDAAEADEAVVAFARYGKGRGHPARLNMGDCFAHACATTRGGPRLFVGDDFVHTDIPSANT